MKNRASQWGALFVCLLLIGATPAWALECPAAHIDERAAVARVVDGDTLHLKDGRAVRFIGINSPEIGHDGKPSEPLAKEARQALKAMLGEQATVGLQYGRERHDRYGRLLAHVYTADGDSVEARLLAAGLAAQIIMPPNVAQLDCYQAAERRARQADKGVWQGIYRPTPVLQLPREVRGFRVVSGRVERVGESKRSVWLDFERRPGVGPREGLAVRIARKDLADFPDWRPQSLRGKTLTVRGWIYAYKRQQVIRVRHPASMEVAP
jgi:endonuclease YncB( thermonuclease family)